MPLQTVTLQAGVNAELTAAQAQATIISSQLVRFKGAGNNRLQTGIVVPDILVEKLGGWTKFYPLSLGSPVRDLHAWEGLNADTHLAAGCETSLDVISSGVAVDVTPHTLITNPAVDFSTTSGGATVTIVDAGLTPSTFDSIFLLTPVSVGGLILSGAYQIITVAGSTSYTITAASNATTTVSHGGAVPVFTTTVSSPFVNVQLTGHGETVGETFAASVPTTVGGIVISGGYIIQAVVDANNFTIINSVSATSSATGAMNGGNAAIEYFIGSTPNVPPAGYGVGTYGTGSYGIGISPTPTPGTPITTSNWTLDNWGEVLIACPANGPIYTWSPDSGFSTANKIVGAPLINGGIFVSNSAQILIAWASSLGGVQDPLLVQWSDSGDYTNWSVSALTQAGNYRIPTGSKIVGGMAGPQFNLIWTDLDVWAMDYVEPPLVYGFNKLATNCGLIGRHAYATADASVYWMGNKQFYVMTGGSVTSIPCPVWDFIFQDLDTNHLDKIYCASNNGFGEVAWYFPSKSGGTGEIDSYVKVNTDLGYAWDFGRLQRTAWIDQSVVGQPIGADASGYVYQHEISPDADGQPMLSSFSTGYFQVADGDQLNFIDWCIPDFREGTYAGAASAILDLSINFTDYPGSPAQTVGPFNITSTTPFVNPRLRARYAALMIGSSNLGSFWRMGGLKLRATPDGRL